MIKKIIKKTRNYLKENDRLNKAAVAEYRKRNGPTSDSPYHMTGIKMIKKELKKKSKIEKYY
jgi:hypothetical protein